MKKLFIICFTAVFVFGQGRLTGNVSVTTSYTNYDDASKLWTKSILNDSLTNRGPGYVSDFDLAEYSTSYLVPGFTETLNMSLFYFTEKYKVAFYSKINNNDWIQPSELRYINRLSLNVTFNKHKVILGDDYIDSHHYFISQRKIRGASSYLNIYENDENNDKLSLKAYAGIIDYKNNVGDPVVGRYQSYYSVNRFQRNLYGSEIDAKFFDNDFEFKLGFITGSDAAEGNLDSVAIRPYENSVIGSQLMYRFVNKKLYVFADYFTSVNDTVYSTHTVKGDNASSYSAGFGLQDEAFKLKLSAYSIDPNYYTFGQPYLITDRAGLHLNAALDVPKQLKMTGLFDLYSTNIDENSNSITLNSKELDFKAELPVTETFSIHTSFIRLSDISTDAINYINNPDLEPDFTINRVSNTIDGQLSFKIDENQLNLFGGFNTTDDLGIYGFEENEETGVDETIGGVSSKRIFYGVSGFYNYERLFSINSSVTINNLTQIDVDRSNIFTFQMNSNYNAIEGILRFNFLMNVSASDNELSISDYFGNLNESSKSRYRLFSAINQFTHNYFEFSSEYIYDYSIRFNLSVRYDDKKYKYLDDANLPIGELRSHMLDLNNPSFFNQKESYKATLFKLSIGYLL